MPARADVQIPPGFQVIAVTNDDYWDSAPRMNNCGQIVFSKVIEGGSEEIFLWDRGTLIQITDNDVRDAFPDINDEGTIVWSQSKVPNGDENDLEIAVYEHAVTTIITDDDLGDWGPRVNNLGHIAWNRDTGGSCNENDIMFHDGVETWTLASDGYSNQVPAINDSDDVAWTRYNFCANPWEGTIVALIEGEIIELGDPIEQNQGVDINNLRQVTWGNMTRQIFVWEDGVVSVAVDYGRFPKLNNNGDIAFARWNEEATVWEQWAKIENEIVLVADGAEWNANGVINDYAEITWHTGDPNGGDILLLELAPGHTDGDGVVNLNDYQMFPGCLTGPLAVPASCVGWRGDWDADGDTDLLDFVSYQLVQDQGSPYEQIILCLTGPMPPRDRCSCRLVDINSDTDVDLSDYVAFQRLVTASP
jgi:hypothetical protein